MTELNDPGKPKLGVKSNDLTDLSKEGILFSDPVEQFGDTGVFDSKFDTGINPGNIKNLESIRTVLQPVTDQVANASIKTLLGAGLGIVENVGYLGELVFDWEENKDYSNALTEWASGNRKDLDEALPVRRDNPNEVFDLGDPAWWIDHGSNLVESIGEFLVTGYGVGGALSKTSKGVANLLKARGLVKQGLTAGSIAGTSSSLAYVEGAMSGSQVYKDIYKEELLKHGDKEIAAKKASEGASTTVKLNTTLNSLLNVTSVAPLFKTAKYLKATDELGINGKLGYIRNLENNALGKTLAGADELTLKSTKNFLGSLGGEAFQEALEESVNVFAEAEGRGKLKGATGFDRFIEAVFTEEGALSAILGAVGGAGQKIGINAISSEDNEERGRQEVFKNYISDLKADFNEISEAQKELQEAVKSGNESDRRIAENKLFNTGLKRSLANGTGEEFIEDYEKVARTDNKELGDDGMTDAMRLGYSLGPNDNTYQVKAQDKIKDIKHLTREFERIFNDYAEDEQTEQYARELFSRRVNIYQRDKELKAKQNDLNEYVAANNDLLNSDNDRSRLSSLEEALKDIRNISGKNINEFIANPDLTTEEKLRIHTETVDKFKEDIVSLRESIKESDSNLDKFLEQDGFIQKVQKDILLEQAKLQADREEYSKITNAKNTNDFIKKYEKQRQKEVEEVGKLIKNQEIKREKKEGKVQYENAKQGLVNDVKEIVKTKPSEGGFINPTNEEIVSGAKFAEQSDADILKFLEESGELPTEQPQENTTESTNNPVEEPVAESPFKKLKENGIELEGINPDEVTTSIEDVARTIHNTESTIEPDFEGPQNLTKQDYETDKKIEADGFSTDGKLLVNAANSIAYRTKAFDGERTITEELEDDLSRELLSPKFNVGQKIKFEIDVTFPTYAELQNDPLRVPIAIKKNNKTIGYVHDIDYIRPDRVANGDSGNNIEQQKQKLKDLRNAIVLNNGGTGVITNKSLGTLSITVDGSRTRSIRSSDKLAIGKLGTLYENNTDELSDEIVNNKDKFGEETNGRVFFTHVTPNGKKIAIPTINSKLNTEQVNTILNATRIYLNGPSNEIEAKMVEDILSEHEYDITKQDGLIKLYNTFIYTYNLRDQEKVAKLEQDITNTDRKFIDVVGNGVMFLSTGKNLFELTKNTPPKERERLLAKLKLHLEDTRFNVDITKINTPGSYKVPVITESGYSAIDNKSYNEYANENITSNIVFNNLGNNEYSIFDQPTIEFQLTKDVALEQKTEKTEDGLKKTELVKSTKPDFPTLVKKKPKFKKQNKPDDAFDDSIIHKLKDDISELIIPGFTAYEQSQVINTITSMVLFYIQSDGKITQNKAFTKAKQFVSSLNNEASNKTLDNFDKFIPFVKDKISNIGFIETNENVFSSKSTFEISPKLTASKRLKQFLSFIPDAYIEEGEIYDKESVLEHYLYKDFDEVFDELSAILADTPPVFDDMIAKLKQNINAKPWIRNLIEEIEGHEGDIDLLKFDFVKSMSKTYSNYKVAIAEDRPIKVRNQNNQFVNQRDSEGELVTNYNFKLIDSNRDTIYRTILTDWNNNLKNSKLVKSNGEDLVFLPNEVDALNQSIIDLQQNPTKEKLQKVLKDLGIEVTDPTLNTILNSKFNKLKFKDQFTDRVGLFRVILDKLEGYQEEPRFDIRNPLNDNVIDLLAREDSKHTSSFYSNSSRNVEGNVVYSYSLNKAITSKTRKLKSEPDYVNKLLESKFNSPNMFNGKPRGENWLWKLQNESYFRNTFNVTPFDGLKSNLRSKGKPLNKMNSVDHQILSLGLFQNQNNGTKDGLLSNYLLTVPGKTTSYIVTAQRHNTVITNYKDFALGKSTQDALYAIVDSEIRRMNHAATLTKKPAGFHPNKFYFFPSLNKETKIWNKDGTLKNEEEIVDGSIKVRDIIFNTVINDTKELLNTKLDEFKNSDIFRVDNVSNKVTGFKYIDSTYLNSIIKKTGEDVTDQAMHIVADLTINTLIARANMHQTLIGDPALFYKGNGNPDTDTQSSFDNIGKRLAKLIAPGLDIPLLNKDEKFISIKVADAKIDSHNKELVKKFSDYGRIESTDSQEWTTLKEHLTLMHRNSEITTDKFNEIVTQIDKGIEPVLSKEDLVTIVTSIKPVYVDTVVEDGIAREEYIKSSAFPLIPQLTKGLEIDKLRVEAERIEKQKGLPVRIAFKSATKLGGYAFSTIFDDNGNIKDNLNLDRSVVALPRAGLRIQQETPYNENKKEITKGVQETVLLFNNVTSLDFDGKTGLQLRQEYYDLNKKLYEKGFKKLKTDLGGDNTIYLDRSLLNINKLSDLLISEAKKRNYSTNELKSLLVNPTTNNFEVPLWASSIYKKNEPLITSLFTNNVTQHKLPGDSYTLLSEEGWKGKSKDIVYTKDYDPKTGLKPASIVDGKVTPAEIIVPFYFRNKNGDLVDVKNYVKDGFLDLNKVPEELLETFGYRIPTQSHSFMSYSKVVGFMPNYVKNVILAPKDFVTQMGSDFDFDKLYMYHKKGFVKENGEIIKDENFATENDLLDLHIKVMSHPKVYEMMTKPESTGDLKELSQKIVNKRKANKVSNYLTDSYNRDKYLESVNGGVAIGVKSLDSTFNANIQGKDLKLNEDSRIVFGNNSFKAITLTDLSKQTGINGQLKSDVLGSYQSAALDNESDPILGKINSNPTTFNVERAMTQVGLSADAIVNFLNQDAIIDLVKEVELNPFKPLDEIIDTVKQKYPKTDYKKNPYYPIPLHELYDAINNPKFQGKYLGYNELQLLVLDKFSLLDGVGKQIKSLQSATNTFNAGLGKNLIEVADKATQIYNIENSSIINAKNLIGSVDNPDTLLGYASVFGTIELNNTFLHSSSNNTFSDLFVYRSNAFKQIVGKIESYSNKELTNDQKVELFDELRSFTFLQSKSLFDTDINQTREELMFDRDTESLATLTSKFKRNAGKHNPFIKRLSFVLNPNGSKPSLIHYKASKAENVNESIIHQGFIDLIANPVVIENDYTTQDLATDLVKYAYINGGNQDARSFIKYIPFTYLKSVGFFEDINNINFENEDFVPSFINQYLQHNPGAGRVTDIGSKGETIKINYLSSDILTPEYDPFSNAYTMQPIEIFSVFDTNARNNHILYRLTDVNTETGTAIYERIDTLGLPFYKEYNPSIANNKIANTLIGNKPRKKSDASVTPNIKLSSTRFDDKTILTNNTSPINKLLNKDYKEIIKEIQNSIISNNAIVADLLNKLDLNIKYSTINDPSKKKGQYYNGTVFINTAKIKDYKDAEETFLHEMLHAATSEIFNNPEKATPKQKLAINSIKSLRENARKKVNAEQLERFEILLQRIRNGEELTDEERNEAIDLAPRFYGLTNDKEFLTAIMTNAEFQESMNRISIDGKSINNSKSLLSRFFELLNDLIAGFKNSGIDVNKDNTLFLAVRETVSLLESVGPTYDNAFDSGAIETQLNLKPNNKIKVYTDHSEVLKQAININTNMLANAAHKAVVTNAPNKDGGILKDKWVIKIVNSSDDVFDVNKRELSDKATKIVNSLESRIKSINNSISSANATNDLDAVSKLKDRREQLKENISSIVTDDRTSTLLAVATDELSNVSKILNSEKVSPNDLVYSLKTINLWQHSLDLLLDPNERDEDTAIFKAIKNIVGEAVNLKNIWDDIAVNRLRTEVSKELERDDIVDEHLTSMPDIGFYSRETLDISRSGNAVLSSISSWMRKASSATNLEAADINDKINKLNKEVKKTDAFKKEGWDLFAQTTTNKEGEVVKTGNMVFPILQDYFDQRAGIIKGIKKLNGWKKFLEWKAENHDIVDARKLYKEDEKDGTLKRVGNKEYENELRNIFKEDTDNLLEDLQDKINLYNGSRIAEINRLQQEHNNISSRMKKWTATRHPFIYLDGVIDGKDTAISIDNKVILNKGYKFTVERVKEKWADPKFQKIKNNPVLFEYYNYINEVMDDMYKLLPSDLKNDMQLNSIPNVKKSIIEDYNQNGMNHAVKELGAWFKESVLSEDSDFKVTDDVDPTTLKPEHRFVIPTLSKLGAEEKSYDLSKTVKLFSHYVLAYKHKSKVEDLIKLGQTVVNQAVEEQMSPSKKPILDVNGNKLSTKGGLSNIKVQLDNTIDKFYGISSEKEIVSSVKVLNKNDKATKQSLLAEIETIKENKEGRPKEEVDELVKNLQQEIKDLGKNLSFTKMIDGILKFVQLKGMGLNVFSAFTNVNFGFLSGLTWSAGGVDFNTSQYMKANGIMLSSVGSNLKNGGKNKVNALIKRFDVLKETYKELYDSRGEDKLYILQSSGEYMVQGSVMVAMMLNKEVKDVNGKTRTLWEAYDVDGNWKVDEFGENSEWQGDINDLDQNKEFFKFKNAITQVNKSIHGNYDPESPVLAKSRVVGRALLQFRSWIAEGVANRFEVEKDDALLNRKRKGRYRTYMDVGFLKSFKLMLKSMIDKNAYDEVSDVDKENLRKNFVGLAQLVSIYTLAMMLKYGLDDDDDERKISLFYINQLNRLNNDLMFFVSPMAFESITRSAIPAFNLVIDTSKLIHAVGESLENGDTLKTGMNRGKSRIGTRAAKLFPVINQISRLDSSTKIEYNNN